MDSDGTLYTTPGGGGSDDIFICTITGAGTTANPYVCDKTTAEIYAASNAGKLVFCTYGGTTLQLAVATSTSATFRGFRNTNDIQTIKFTVASTGKVTRSYTIVPTPTVDTYDFTEDELNPDIVSWEQYSPGVFRLQIAEYAENSIISAFVTSYSDGGNADGTIPQVMLTEGKYLSILVAADNPPYYYAMQIRTVSI